MPSVTLYFTQQSDDETEFEVQRKELGGSFASLTTVAADATTAPSPVTFQDLSVLNGITYVYRVRAKNGSLVSAWSNETTITISGAPPPPPVIIDGTDLGGIRAQMPRAYGMDGVFGRGAGVTPMIIRVNTLNWNTALSAVGDGTLQGGFKAAATYNGPAYVLLEDSGIITCGVIGGIGAQMLFPYKTIAGQCAPGQGVSLEGNADGIIEVNTHDVLFQHFRVRAGGGGGICGGAIGVWYYGSAISSKVVFDHISASWGQDEVFYVKGNDVAFWRCLAAESLYQTPGSEACGGIEQGHGLLVGTGGDTSGARIAVIGCLFVSCGRGPELHDNVRAFIADTVNYNGCGPVSTSNPAASLWYQSGEVSSRSAYINFRAKQGPDTPDGYAAIRVYYDIPGNQVYLRDCTSTGTYLPFVYSGADPRVGISPVDVPGGWASVGSSALESWIAANVGAFPNNRDSADDAFVNQMLDGNSGGWKQTRPSSPSIAHSHATFSVPSNPFGDIDEFGRNNMDRALDAKAITRET